MTTEKTLFSTAEAAEYLDLPVGTLKYHIHVANPPNLVGQLVGNSLVFTKEELDRFKAAKRPQGRPAKTTDK